MITSWKFLLFRFVTGCKVAGAFIDTYPSGGNGGWNDNEGRHQYRPHRAQKASGASDDSNSTGTGRPCSS